LKLIKGDEMMKFKGIKKSWSEALGKDLYGGREVTRQLT
jgi:hypothetical protein